MSEAKVNIALARTGFSKLLSEEFADRFSLRGVCINEDAVTFDSTAKLPALQNTVFVRQYLPLASPFRGADLQEAVQFVFRKIEVASQRGNRQTGRWTLHAFALDDNAATQRAAKVEKGVMAAVRTKLARLHKRFVPADELVKDTLQKSDFLVQIYVVSPSELWVSVASFAAGVSIYIGGNLRMRARADAPSRSARKLEEAFLTLGRYPEAGETAVDLGAAPGGWTYCLARRGASVLAVDAAALDLPPGKALTKRVTQIKDNGIKFLPEGPVDWLCCDMIVASHETLRVLNNWFEKQLMQHFVVNLKLPKTDEWPAIKNALTLLQQQKWAILKARHLYHDRREITLMGSKDTAQSGLAK